MKVAISQSNFIPWKGYFDLIDSVDHFVVYDEMQYTKRDWRNRNKIKTSNGVLWVSVPVSVKGKYYQKINETMISEKSWGRKTWATIQHNYSKAPYFKEYSSRFEDIFLDESISLLSDLNLKLLKLVCDILEIKTQFHLSRDFKLAEDRNQRLVDICRELEAEIYVSGPAAKDYLDENLFREHNIKVEWFKYENYLEYPQLNGDFNHFVSVLDLLFNTGEESKKLFKGRSHL